MLETPETVQAISQPAAVIALRIPRAEIHKVMGPAIGEVIAAASAQGIGPAGAFSHHFKMSPDVFDFEVGIPVRAEVRAVGRVKPGRLPGGRALRAVYRGPYEGLGAAWGEFCAWARDHGHKTGPKLWECYIAGPESGADPAKWRTELNLPLTD